MICRSGSSGSGISLPFKATLSFETAYFLPPKELNRSFFKHMLVLEFWLQGRQGAPLSLQEQRPVAKARLPHVNDLFLICVKVKEHHVVVGVGVKQPASSASAGAFALFFHVQFQHLFNKGVKPHPACVRSA